MALLFADPCFLEHDTGQHPECSERLRSVYKHLDETGLVNRFAPGTISDATTKQLSRVHTPGHISHIQQLAHQGGGHVESDTIVSPKSFDVAVRAAGAAIAAVDNVLDETPHRRAICLIRPPGHHAVPNVAMGFCLFNNVAVAAKQAQDAHGLNRILIVDWDVHHGNGTQDIFYHDDSVYFFSAHRYPFYPGTGAEDETGSGAGLGTVFNLPLSFGISRSEYLQRFQSTFERAAERCQPELVLVSAGFDAHAADPIGSLGLESEDFQTLTEMIVSVANHFCDGRIVSVLEGGYNVTALAESVGCHLKVLAEE